MTEETAKKAAELYKRKSDLSSNLSLLLKGNVTSIEINDPDNSHRLCYIRSISFYRQLGDDKKLSEALKKAAIEVTQELLKEVDAEIAKLSC